MKTFLCVLVALAACGGKIEGQSDNDTPQTYDQFCSSATKVTCEKIYGCSNIGDVDRLKQFLGKDVEACKTLLLSTCKSGSVRCTVFDPASASQCVKDYQALTCGDIALARTNPMSCASVCK